MNSTQLDTFETALLAELRREVAEHPAPGPSSAPLPPPARRPRRRLRLAAVGATAAAASVVAVLGLGGPGGSPAYAVETNADGDVIVTVHRLDDAGGLERALRAEGIDADVSYEAEGFGPTVELDADGEPPAPGEGGPEDHIEARGITGPGHTEVGPKTVRPADGDDPCGLGGEPATLTQQGSDWVLAIPADSPLQDRHVEIGTDSTGALSVAYAGDEPNSMCGMVTVTRAPQTAR